MFSRKTEASQVFSMLLPQKSPSICNFDDDLGPKNRPGRLGQLVPHLQRLELGAEECLGAKI